MIDASVFDSQVIYDKLYVPIPKFYEFFAAEKKARKLLWLGGNRTRKTSTVIRGISYHLRGWYPEDWPGHKFTRPIRVLVTTVVMEKTINVLQGYFLRGDPSKGLSPCLHKSLINYDDKTLTVKSKSASGYEQLAVSSIHGGHSIIRFGAHKQGPSQSQGDSYDIILIDECSNIEYYTELNMRATAFEGEKSYVYNTMWPEKGKDEVVARFLNNAAAGEVKNHHFYMKSSWSDNPSLTEEEKDLMRISCPPWQLEAREHGTPIFGHGKVFCMSEKEIFIKKHDLPENIDRFAYLYGLDPAATSGGTWGMVLLAYDRENDIIYAIKDYKKNDLTLMEHGYNITQKIPSWNPPGINDYAGAGENQHTKEKTIDFMKNKCGLRLSKANKSSGTKENTIDEIYFRNRSGRIKIVEDECPNLVEEWRGYARNEKGTIIKENDHCIDALLYAIAQINLSARKDDYDRMKSFYRRSVGYESGML